MSGSYRGRHAAKSRRNAVLWAAGTAVVLVLLAGAVFFLKPPSQAAGPGSQMGSSAQQPGENPDAAGSASGSGAVSVLGPAQDTDVSAPPPQVPKPEPYDFSQPVPEGEAVENSYFDDAAFVGDSRTDGFMIYSGVKTGKNLTSNGLSIFRLAEKKALTIGGEKYTLLEALALEEYGKVYLSLGVNELGVYKDDAFYESYCDAIDQIRAVQPSAVIYIQGLIPLNEKQIEDYNGNRFNLTNKHLRVYNDLMRKAAEEKQVAFLDLYSEFVDENEELPKEGSRDGVHLSKEYCQRWLEYLKHHTVDFDALYPDGPPTAEPVNPDQPEQPDTSTADGSVSG